MADDGGRLRRPGDLIADLVAPLGLDGMARHVDLAGQAVYFLAGDDAGTDWTFVACVRCRYVGSMMALPRKPVLFWRCSSGHTIRLEPPIPVLVAAMRPIPGDPRRPPIQ
jgi:hypothetical protein